MQKKIILFELNEVPHKVVDQFCRWRPQSALARLLQRCHRYETYAEDRTALSPWKTWPSVYRGVPDEQHLIYDFGQDLREADQAYPPIWQILAQHGVEVGIWGTLHSYPMPRHLDRYAFYVPDAFAAGAECFPASLEAFQAFNLRMSRESARNVSRRVPWRDALRLLKQLPDFGFKMSTLADVGGQLVSEQAARWKIVRRRTYQSVLSFDIFMHYLKKTKPAFATFFTNHVASSLHRYWAAAFPEDYDEITFDEQWMRTYQSEILFTMEKADQFFARLAAFVDRHRGYSLWVATSMGQEATVAASLETQLYITDLEQFMARMGLQPHQWQQRPAMLPQTNVMVVEHGVDDFRERLESLRVHGEPVYFREAAEGFFSIVLGQPNLYEQPPVASLAGNDVPFAELGLENVEIQDKSGTTAYHIPQGCLFVYDPLRAGVAEHLPQISTLDIAPAILKNYAVPLPPYMKRPASIG